MAEKETVEEAVEEIDTSVVHIIAVSAERAAPVLVCGGTYKGSTVTDDPDQVTCEVCLKG